MHLYISEAEAVGYRRLTDVSHWGKPGSLASSVLSDGGALAQERGCVAHCLLCSSSCSYAHYSRWTLEQ